MRPTISNFCNTCGAWKGELGLEPTPQMFVEHIVLVFREVKRVLRDDGVIWVNLGDSYTGSGKGGNPEAGKQATNKGSQTVGVLYGKTGERQREAAQTNVTRDYDALPPKNLVGIPWRVAFALQDEGWYLRQDIIWHKPGPMPESMTDRCTKAHEYIFLLSKNPRYFFDNEAIKEPSTGKTGSAANFKRDTKEGEVPGELLMHRLERESTEDNGFRNKRSVWTISSGGYDEAHFAVYPEALVEPCILAGTSEHGACPECGSPWRRMLKKTPMVIDRSERTHEFGHTRSSGTMVEPAISETVGWEPTCKCVSDKPLRPCLVLDPFCGSGTTGVVSLRYHRDFIGCELNPEYASMAERRINNEAPMFNEVEVK